MPSRVSLPLRNVTVASPCPAKWAEMDGDDRRRFCHQCSKHVYDFGGLTADGVRELLADEGSICGRFYQRADGTVLTADCPIGWRLARTRLGRIALRAAAFAVALCGAAITTLAHAESGSEAFARSPAMTALQRFTGRLTPPPGRFILGDISIPSSPSSPSGN